MLILSIIFSKILTYIQSSKTRPLSTSSFRKYRPGPSFCVTFMNVLVLALLAKNQRARPTPCQQSAIIQYIRRYSA